ELRTQVGLQLLAQRRRRNRPEELACRLARNQLGLVDRPQSAILALQQESAVIRFDEYAPRTLMRLFVLIVPCAAFERGRLTRFLLFPRSELAAGKASSRQKRRYSDHAKQARGVWHGRSIVALYFSHSIKALLDLQVSSSKLGKVHLVK